MGVLSELRDGDGLARLSHNVITEPGRGAGQVGPFA